MGLPRYLADKATKFAEEKLSLEMAYSFGVALTRAGDIPDLIENSMLSYSGFKTRLGKSLRNKPSGESLLTIRYGEQERIKPIRFKYYTNLKGNQVVTQSKHWWSFRLLRKWYRFHQKRELYSIQVLGPKINALAEIRKKVYKSRNFPPRLRHFIFERDGYTCQTCLKGKEKLKKEGLHLEVDHVEPYYKGGLTTFDNGQTLCSLCNKGKYHYEAVAT